MLLEHLTGHYADQAPERFRTLAASTAGHCQRRLAYSQFPERFTPEPMSVRRRVRLAAGKQWEAFVGDVVMHRVAGRVAGESCFLWPVHVGHAVMQATLEKIGTGRINGHVLPDFKPDDLPRYKRACEARGFSRYSGIIADPAWEVVLIPALADFIADDPTYGLATCEMKTLATGGFRRVMQGDVDYLYRVQCAIQIDAAHVDTHTLLVYRIETGHVIQILSSKRLDVVTVDVMLSNGQRRSGTLEEPLRDDEWDALLIRTPFDDRLLEDARWRLRNVLAAPSADDLPAREYGPHFTCQKCRGTGIIACRYCREVNGERISKHSPTGKLCRACHATGEVTCPGCHGLPLMDAELAWQCRYCPHFAPCYGPVTRIEIPPNHFARPRYLVSRVAFDDAGIVVAPLGEAAHD